MLINEVLDKALMDKPKKGLRWTERLRHLGVVLDCNEYAVLWSEATVENGDGYSLDYRDAKVISIDKYRQIVQYGELISPDRDFSKRYWNEVKEGVHKPIKLPDNEFQYKELLIKENPVKEVNTNNHPKILIMSDMSTVDKEAWYIELPNGTYVEVELVDDKYEIFVRDKKGIQGFKII